jgi:hypothetical protein
MISNALTMDFAVVVVDGSDVPGLAPMTRKKKKDFGSSGEGGANGGGGGDPKTSALNHLGITLNSMNLKKMTLDDVNEGFMTQFMESATK